MGLDYGESDETKINEAIEKWKSENAGKECGNKGHNDGLKHILSNIRFDENHFVSECRAYHPAVEGEWHEEQYINNVDETKWTDALSNSLTPYSFWANKDMYSSSTTNAIRAKGITFQLPEGTPFGFFIDVYEDKDHTNYSHRCYSSANLNEQAKANVYTQINEKAKYIFYSGKSKKATNNGWIEHVNADEHKYVTASYFSTTTTYEDETGNTTTDNRTFFGFEDWGIDEVDLNDFICMVDESVVEQDDIVVNEDDPEPEPWEWIIACEDLGTNDFDFNDVVFSVSNFVVNAENPDKATITVTALAAGGTLPVYLYLNNEELRPDGAEESEFHTWFGNYNSATVINAASIRATGKSATVTVNSDFTMECCKTAKDGNMGGFQVKVIHANKAEIISATNPNVESSIGEAPQMICVPPTWCWPKENVFIPNVYPLFTDWCASQYSHNDWHETRNSGYWER